MSRIGIYACMLLVLLPAAMFNLSHAQEEINDAAFSKMVARWNAILDFPEQLLAESDVAAQAISPLRENVIVVQELATTGRIRAEHALASEQKLLAALGPAPAEGEAAEAAEIAAERNGFTRRMARYDSRVKQCSLVIVRSNEILDRINALELGLIANILGKRSDSPFAPSTIGTGFRQVPERANLLAASIAKWWRETRFDAGWSSIMLAMLAFIVAVLVILITRKWLLGRFRRDPEIERPTLTQRFIAIVVETLTRVLMPALVIVGVAFVVFNYTPLPLDLRFMFYALAFSMLQYVVITGLTRTALAAQQPQWRIVGFTDAAAARLDSSIWLFAVAGFVANMVLVFSNPLRHQTGPIRLLDFDNTNELTIVVGMICLIVMSAVTLHVLDKRNWRFRSGTGDAPAERPARVQVRTVFAFARIGLVLAVVAGVFGYLNLGTYVAGRTILTLGLMGAALLIHGLMRESLRQATSAENPVGLWVRQRLGLDDTGANRGIFWVILLVDMVLIVISISVLLGLWGIPWAELQPVFKGLVYGTEIGDYTFSLINIGIALGVFALLLLTLRLFQRFLSNRILVQTRLDVGVRDAVTAGVGYVGIVIAALIGLSLLGLQFSELALIFGALSVGIGFGLQHVVNNFVSGLILLIQRPVKAGDWVVIGSQQGYVKRINVISTEIQTFDNATVIVPNSNLMTTEVLNWMHRGRLGRVVISVGVSYDSDPRQVEQILLKCAGDDNDILARPAPQVIFKEFGNSSLDFELRFYIRDIDYRIQVASRQRFAIKEAFDQAGIEIPFPQSDVHIRDIAAAEPSAGK